MTLDPIRCCACVGDGGSHRALRSARRRRRRLGPRGGSHHRGAIWCIGGDSRELPAPSWTSTLKLHCAQCRGLRTPDNYSSWELRRNRSSERLNSHLSGSVALRRLARVALPGCLANRDVIPGIADLPGAIDALVLMSIPSEESLRSPHREWPEGRMCSQSATPA